MADAPVDLTPEARRKAESVAEAQFRKKYGGLAPQKPDVLHHRKDQRKFFDSADFFREKQGIRSPMSAGPGVGHPSPSDAHPQPSPPMKADDEASASGSPDAPAPGPQ